MVQVLEFNKLHTVHIYEISAFHIALGDHAVEFVDGLTYHVDCIVKALAYRVDTLDRIEQFMDTVKFLL